MIVGIENTWGRRQTLRSLARAISRDRLRRFAAELLRRRDEVRGGEIHLKGPDDLPLLIYLLNYGDGSLGYRVEESENAEWIERDGVGSRDFVIRKSETEQPEDLELASCPGLQDCKRKI